MPGIPEENDKKTQIMAICAPSPPATTTTTGDTSENSTHNNGASVSQPRQPANLQGLLRFAMEATEEEHASSESNFAPMDEEKMKFLESALKSMTINVVEILQEQIKHLMKVDTIKEGDDVTIYLEALETILDFIDNIDIANDFHKIGGFLVLKPCLNSVNPAIRAGGCALIAELCQNNPYCQGIVLDNEFIPILLNILNTDDNAQVGVKCLYALSALSRDNTNGFSQLIRYGGFNTFMKTLQKDDDRFRVKTAFLLNSLCRTQPDLKCRLVFLEIIPILISLLSQERKPSTEHILGLLLSLVEDNMTALNECKNPQYNLKEILQDYISKIENFEECREEEQHCKALLHKLFA